MTEIKPDPAEGMNMFWDDQDPEQQYGSPEEWAGDVWGGKPGQTTTVTFMTGQRGPNVTYLVRANAAPDSDDVDYTFEPVEPAKR